MTKLDQSVNDYYQSKTLSSSRMQAILAQSQRSRRRRRYPAFAAAAVLLIAIAGTLHHRSLHSQRVSVALKEAAMNHATRLQLDVEAQSLPTLQANLEKLPFDLVLPEAWPIYRRC